MAPDAELSGKECSWQEPAAHAALSAPKALMARSIMEIAETSEPDLPGSKSAFCHIYGV